MNTGVQKYEEVNIVAGETSLIGELSIPPDPKAIVIFSHGSGSSRFSKRNRQIAEYLKERNFGVLLFDLLTPEEDIDYKNRFNIELLSKRLINATLWLTALPVAKDCRIGYFGASTGAASALQAAASLKQVNAIVSRGGRPDLTSFHALKNVRASVLLIVGSLDKDVLQLNKQAFAELQCPKEFVIVEGASHLFEEPGKMDEVARLSSLWFEKYLIRSL